MTNEKKEEKKFGGFVKPLTEVVDRFKEANEKELGVAKAMFENRKEDLEKYMDSMGKRAEILVDDLKRKRIRFNGEEKGFMSKADCFRDAVGTFQNSFSNVSFENAARVVSEYERWEAIVDVLEGKGGWKK